MALPVVNTCCCGCSLKTGSLIIGWVEVVFSIIGIIGFTLVFMKESETKSHNGTEMSFWSNVIGMLIFIILLVLGVLLIIGADRSLPKYVNIWVVLGIVDVIIDGISVVIKSIMLFVAGEIVESLSILLIVAITILLQMYFIIVVSSFRKEIAEEN